MLYQLLEKLNKFFDGANRRRVLVRVLSVVVVFCTTYSLILPAITLERDEAEENGVIAWETVDTDTVEMTIDDVSAIESTGEATVPDGEDSNTTSEDEVKEDEVKESDDARIDASPSDVTNEETTAYTEEEKTGDEIELYNFAIRGIHEINLSEIFKQLDISLGLDEITSISTDNDEAVSVVNETGKDKTPEYVVVHNLPFFDSVTMTIKRENASDLQIVLTDEEDENLKGYKIRVLDDGTVVFDMNPVVSKGRKKAPARNADGSVQTITNPAGTTIDLFDYWVYGDTPNDNWPWYVPGVDTFPGLSGVGNELGINEGHAIKFEPASDRTVYDGIKSGDQTYDGESRHPNVTGRGGINAWTGSATPMKGMVEQILGNDGYPVSTSNDTIGTNGESLSYLFDDSQFSGKNAYMGTDQLFHVDDDGYYVYDSDENSAIFNPSTNTFTVGDENGGFWPFGQGSYWFGVHMNTPFSQPRDGLVLNPSGQYMPMTYSFSGDDDVWIYIDGVLIGDAGGIHSATDVDIDFQTGEVRINGVDQGTIRDFYKAAGKEGDTSWDGDTFASGTYHTMDFFYMERGAGASNMKIRYNMISTADFTAHKSYVGENSSDLLKRDQFQFELIGLDGKYSKGNDGTLTQVDENAEAIMPIGAGSHTSGAGTVADPRYEKATLTLSDGSSVSAQRYTVGDTEDGNVNFGMTGLNGDNCTKGDTYRYIIKEVIPEGATENGDGTYTYNGVVYDQTVYYMAATVTSWYTNGEEDFGLSKTYYTDDTFTEKSDVTFINFTNKHTDSDIPTLYMEPVANKVLIGKRLTDGQFKFQLKDSNGNVIQEAKNDAIGKVEFDKITFDSPGTYKYYISEVNDGQDDYEYDDHVCELTVEVIRNANNTYSVKSNYSDNTFENSYTKEPEEGVTIQTTKVLEGRELNAGEFSFSLEEVEVDSSGNIVTDSSGDAKIKSGGKTATAVNGADGSVKFPLEKVFSRDDFSGGKDTVIKAFKIVESVPHNDNDKLEGIIYDEDGVVYAFVQAGYNSDTGEIFVYEPQYSNDISGAFMEGVVGVPEWVPDEEDRTIGQLTVDVSNITLGADGLVRLVSSETGQALSAIPDENGVASFDLDFSDDSESAVHNFVIVSGDHVAPVELTVTPGTSGSEGSGSGADGYIRIVDDKSKHQVGTANAGEQIVFVYKVLNYRKVEDPANRFKMRIRLKNSANNLDKELSITPVAEESNIRVVPYDAEYSDVLLTYSYTIPTDIEIDQILIQDTSNDGPEFVEFRDSNSGTPGRVEVTDFADTYQAASFTPVFTNYYVEPARQSITIHKVLEDSSLSAGQFEFVLKDLEGNEVARAYNDADGNVTFTDVVEFNYSEFENSNFVTKAYTVEEVVPSDAGSKTIDGQTYPLYSESDGIAYTNEQIAVSVTGKLSGGTILAYSSRFGEDDGGYIDAYYQKGARELEGNIVVDISESDVSAGDIMSISGPGVNQTETVGSSDKVLFPVSFSESGEYEFTITSGKHTGTLTLNVTATGQKDEVVSGSESFDDGVKISYTVTQKGNNKWDWEEKGTQKNCKYEVTVEVTNPEYIGNPFIVNKEWIELGSFTPDPDAVPCINTYSVDSGSPTIGMEKITVQRAGYANGGYYFWASDTKTYQMEFQRPVEEQDTIKDSVESEPFMDEYVQSDITDTLTNRVVERKPIGIRLIKVDQTGEALEGATFQLHSGSADGNLIGTFTSKLEGGEAVIYSNQAIDNGTYYLVETDAPDGYQTITEPVVITVSDSGSVSVAGTSPGNIRRQDGVYVIKVMNVAEGGFQLPSTGGSGTRTLSVLGLALILGAGTLILLRRRRQLN